ncbi:MAG TPA: 30S ribosome-binding factor RbfA [Candidatus Hypogeohydataceae bacterium YC38]
MSTRRSKKLEEALRRELSSIILYELKDPRIKFITLTRVELSADLRTAKVHISILGDEALKRKTLRAIEHARGHIQSVAGKRLGVRYTPVLTFCLDETAERGLHVSRLIEEISKEGEEVECQG